MDVAEFKIGFDGKEDIVGAEIGKEKRAGDSFEFYHNGGSRFDRL